MNVIGKMPWKIWVIILISFILPFFIEDAFTIEGIREMRWFLFVVPVFFFAYYFGLRGGVISSLISNTFYLLWEWRETLEGEIHPEWEVYLIFGVFLVNFIFAVGVGLLANQLKLLSITDPLTHLFNRRYINDVQLGKKEAGSSILFIDLDRFKLLNDTLGHRIGDQILQSVSDRLKDLAGEDDMIARYGGDEFVYILHDADMEKIQKKAEDILTALSASYIVEGNELYLTASIGISQSPEHGQDMNTLIAKADMAMYRAKQLGKNQVQFYYEDMNDESVERLEMEKNLRKALKNNELVLYYQPRVDLKTNEMLGMEALVRWQHPSEGLIPPQKFISIAEEAGLIVPIGTWVLYTACKQNKEWQDAGFAPLRVSVNLSARQFQYNLVSTVKKILDQVGLDPQWLELEITESMLMNVEEAVPTLHQLKNLGIYLSIDDFGTGYSSLNYLKRFPIDCLKIDKSFVNDILSDGSIAKAIITLGQNLHLEVIAEGIEEHEQADALLKENCCHGQGYYFSPPIPKQKFEEYMRGRAAWGYFA